MAAAFFWEWKSDLEVDDSDPAGWTRYAEADSAKLEKAREKGQKTLKLNDKYSVNLIEMFQYSNADTSRQRSIRRRGGKRGAPDDDGDGEAPAKKAAKAAEGAAAGGRPDFSQRDPAKTDLVEEAKRRSAMPPPTQAELVFFWYGKYFQKSSTPTKATINPTGKVAIEDSYKSVVACCQRTDSDIYDFAVRAEHFDVGFVEPTDFGNWLAFPYLTCMAMAENKLHVRISTGKGQQEFPKESPVVQFNLEIKPKQLVFKMAGKTKTFALTKLLAKNAVLAFWMYKNKEYVAIV